MVCTGCGINMFRRHVWLKFALSLTKVDSRVHLVGKQSLHWSQCNLFSKSMPSEYYLWTGRMKRQQEEKSTWKRLNKSLYGHMNQTSSLKGFFVPLRSHHTLPCGVIYNLLLSVFKTICSLAELGQDQPLLKSNGCLLLESNHAGVRDLTSDGLQRVGHYTPASAATFINYLIPI